MDQINEDYSKFPHTKYAKARRKDEKLTKYAKFFVPWRLCVRFSREKWCLTPIFEKVGTKIAIL